MAIKFPAALVTAPLSREEQQAIAYYDTHAKDWEKRRNNRLYVTQWEGAIDQFHTYLPSGKILELGSGDGREAQVLINLGYNYVGTDVSGELLKIAQQRNPTGAFIQANMYSLPFQKSEFEGFWAAAVLLHIPRSRIDEALTSIKHVVRPEAIGFISLKEGDGDIVDDATGRYFTLYRYEEFFTVLQRNGFIVEKFDRMLDECNRWLCFYVRVK